MLTAWYLFGTLILMNHDENDLDTVNETASSESPCEICHRVECTCEAEFEERRESREDDVEDFRREWMGQS